MKTFDFPQYSNEWWTARRGLVTASGMDRVMTAKTMKPAAAAAEYICELAGDLANPDYGASDSFMSPAMKNGVFLEPEARSFYEMSRDVDVREVGGCLSDCGRFWCSPDALVGVEGGLECKSPQHKTHVRYLLDGTLPDEYKIQVHGCLIVTGLPWWDFLSYCRGLPPLLVRVTPDAYTDALRVALEVFWGRYQEALEKLGIAKEVAL